MKTRLRLMMNSQPLVSAHHGLSLALFPSLPHAHLSIHSPLATGYHTIKALAAPLQDLTEACAVLPTCLAFSNQGRVGGKEDTL